MYCATPPAWLDRSLYPFESRFIRVEGAPVHYVDEGSGPILLMLHGNPTWSFVYRNLILGLRDRFRCIAIDYPGFGLSGTPAGFGFTPAEHARVVEEVVTRLDLCDATMMIQDWGGPIGCAVAVRQPERFSAFVVGNTSAWPKADLGTQVFSRVLGSRVGQSLITRRNLFVEKILPMGVRRRALSDEVMAAYRGPFSTRESRRPTAVFPREIVASRAFLAEVAAGLSALADRPALIVWPTNDFAFGDAERRRWEALFGDHRTITLDGAGHYIQEDAAEEIIDAIAAWHPALRGAAALDRAEGHTHHGEPVHSLTAVRPDS